MWDPYECVVHPAERPVDRRDGVTYTIRCRVLEVIEREFGFSRLGHLHALASDMKVG